MPFLKSLVWRDLGLNSGLPDHGRTLYPLDHCINVSKLKTQSTFYFVFFSSSTVFFFFLLPRNSVLPCSKRRSQLLFLLRHFFYQNYQDLKLDNVPLGNWVTQMNKLGRFQSCKTMAALKVCKKLIWRPVKRIYRKTWHVSNKSQRQNNLNENS